MCDNVCFITENCKCVTDTKSAILRSKVLDLCYSIKDYEKLPLEVKNKIYDKIYDKIKRCLEN